MSESINAGEAKAEEMCKHCGLKPRRKPRGLCHGCYTRPHIKERYPPLNRGVGSNEMLQRIATGGGRCDGILIKIGGKVVRMDEYHGGQYTRKQLERRGWQGTDALPGSDEKLAVLAYRAVRGLPLWHPDDVGLVTPDEDRRAVEKTRLQRLAYL